MKFIDELNEGNQPVIHRRLSPEQALYLVSKASKVVGLLLHSLIFAYMQNVPFETYQYDVKISGFQQLIQNYSLNEIKNRILNAATSLTSLEKSLLKKRKPMRAQNTICKRQVVSICQYKD